MTGVTCQGTPPTESWTPTLLTPVPFPIPIPIEREEEEGVDQTENVTTVGDQQTSDSPNSTIVATSKSPLQPGPNIPAWEFDPNESGAFLRTVVGLLTNNVHLQVIYILNIT